MIATRELAPGAVLQVLGAAGIELPPDAGKRGKIVLRCPLHHDERPSAFVSPARNLFFCSMCGSFSAKALAEALSLPWPGVLGGGMTFPATRRLPPAEPPPAFGPPLAGRAWNVCLARARDPRARVEDREVLEYLRDRGLSEVLDAEEGLFGVTPPDPRELPEACRTFYTKDQPVYRLAAPLWRPGSPLPVSLQARAVRPVPESAPKIMSPRGSRQAGALFASRAGRRVLAGSGAGRPVILAEGLTDYLALAAAPSGIPVLSAPGAGGAAGAVAGWARGRVVLLALDGDEAGENGARRAAGRVHELGGRPVRLRWPGALKDAADVARARGPRWLGEELRKVVRAGGEETR